MDETVTGILSTDNLELIAATPEHVTAELESPGNLASLLNALVEPDWPPGEYDRDAQEFFLDRLKEGGPDAVGWYTWYAVRRGNQTGPSTLIGAGGYFGPPSSDGTVEIGFSVMPSWRGHGYATEIAGKLAEHAFTDIRVKKVIAHTVPENTASCKVLEKCGFSFVGMNEETGHNHFEILRNE
ncbi:MAG: GNAT family N-acetyltransferase [Candidatus Eremiobacterota bacterium]